MRRSRATRALVLGLVAMCWWLGGGLGAGVDAQDLGDAGTTTTTVVAQPCPVEEGGVPAAAGSGTSTTGQCAPSRRFRLIDSALWVFTLLVLVVVVVALIRGRRTEGDPPHL